ncbi:MAG: nuclear transport factor 2 family protein [Gemmatimonadaceae bacterium]
MRIDPIVAALAFMGTSDAAAQTAALPSPAANPPYTASEQALDGRSHADLLVAREAVWRAWFASDTAALARLLPARMIAIQEGDTIWSNRDQVLGAAREFAADGGRLLRLEFPRTEMQVFGDVVVLYSKFAFETERSGKRGTSRGAAVEVFVKRDGVWQNPSWYLDFDR